MSNPEEPKRGHFSHCYYDNMCETVFLYFHNTTVLSLSGSTPDYEVEEVAIYLEPSKYEAMREYFINHPTINTLF